jgi:dipeptide transport system ATP-binding protein
MRLLEMPPAEVPSGEIIFDGRDLLTLPDNEIRKVRGNDVAMIFQEPMSSLNPVFTLGDQITGKDMAMIFQEPMSSLNPCFTVGYQLTEALKLHLGMDKAQARKRAVELLAEVGIPAPESRLSAFPHQLSGGMSQRVMIAMAISCRPKLLIADEPTTALDVTIQAQILDLLLRLQRETGMALVLITHSMGVVAETAERVQVQYAGQKVEEQPVGSLFAHPRHPYTAALLSALPERAASRRLPSIPGVVPGQFDRPTGCLFAPRCIYATDLCRTTPPPMQAGALCHYPLVEKAA